MIRLAAPLWLAVGGVGVIAGIRLAPSSALATIPVSARWAKCRASLRPFQRDLAAGVLVAMAFAPLAVSLARPQEVLSRQLEHAEGVDMVIALDVSGSMAALDFQPSDRLGVAKETIARFLDRRPHDRIGLVIFAGAAVTICPLTLDHEVADHLLEQVKLRTLPDGTAIGLGLGTAVNRLRASTSDSKVVVLVTDGSNNAGQLDPQNRCRTGEGREDHGPHRTRGARRRGADPCPHARPANRSRVFADPKRGRGNQSGVAGGDRAQHRRHLVSCTRPGSAGRGVSQRSTAWRRRSSRRLDSSDTVSGSNRGHLPHWSCWWRASFSRGRPGGRRGELR